MGYSFQSITNREKALMENKTAQQVTGEPYSHADYERLWDAVTRDIVIVSSSNGRRNKNKVPLPEKQLPYSRSKRKVTY